MHVLKCTVSKGEKRSESTLRPSYGWNIVGKLLEGSGTKMECEDLEQKFKTDNRHLGESHVIRMNYELVR